MQKELVLTLSISSISKHDNKGNKKIAKLEDFHN